MSALRIGPPASGAKCQACGGPALLVLSGGAAGGVVALCGDDADRARDLLMYGVGAAINAQVWNTRVDWAAINTKSEPVADNEAAEPTGEPGITDPESQPVVE